MIYADCVPNSAGGGTLAGQALAGDTTGGTNVSESEVTSADPEPLYKPSLSLQMALVRPHNPKVAGSNPAPATPEDPVKAGFSVLERFARLDVSLQARFKDS